MPPMPPPPDGPPRLFAPARRRHAWQRARAIAARSGTGPAIRGWIADELAERLAMVTRDFADALVLGAPDGRIADQLRARGAAVRQANGPGGDWIEEEALPLAPASLDCIVVLATLETANDLPGALIQLRRALRPDGLLLAAMVGAGSLPRLRAAMLAADDAGAGGQAALRIHPLVDVRAAGDLLARAGFAMPVADGLELVVRYPHLFALVADLRAEGMAAMLADPGPPLTRAGIARAATSFAAAADPDGKTAERFELVFLSGWAPAPGQAKPARRGSATVSLAEALKPKG